MNVLFKFVIVAIVSIASVTMAQAQKIGYFDNQAVFTTMPEVKSMQSQLESLQTQLQKQLQGKLDELQTIQTDAQQRKMNGTLTPLEEENILKDLQKRQQELMSMEQEMQQKLVKKEETLLQPILDKVNAAIEAVAKENGYSYIINSNLLLYTDGSNNVTDMVKAKL